MALCYLQRIRGAEHLKDLEKRERQVYYINTNWQTIKMKMLSLEWKSLKSSRTPWQDKQMRRWEFIADQVTKHSIVNQSSTIHPYQGLSLRKERILKLRVWQNPHQGKQLLIVKISFWYRTNIRRARWWPILQSNS